MSSELANDIVSPEQWPDAIPVLRHWRDEIDIQRAFHLKTSRRFQRLDWVLSGLDVIFAGFAATAMFAALNKRLDDLPLREQLLLTLVVVLPTIASGLQKVWQVPIRHRGHSAKARKYLELMKELDLHLAVKPEHWRDTVSAWHERYRKCLAAPIVPE